MTELAGLYTNLFVITITIIGILLASIIALTQLLEPLLVSRNSQRLIRPAILKFASISLAISALATLPAMALLSLNTHDFVPAINFRLNEVFANQWYVFMVILALIISAILVIIFIYSVSRLLIPVNALIYLKKSSRSNLLTGYFKMSGAQKPIRPLHPISFLLDPEESGDEIGDDGQNVREKEYQASIKRHEAELKKYDADKLKFAKLENPLFPLETYLIRSIQRSNLTIVRNTLKTFEEIISELASIDDFQELSALIEYYKSVLENAHEVAQATGLQSVSLELLNSSSRVSDLLTKKKHFGSLNILEGYWRTQASDSLNTNPTVFKRAINIIGEAGKMALKDEKNTWEDIQDFSDNIMRGLGWLSERLLDSGAPEKRELMLNDNETQFNALMNAVLNLGWEMNTHRANEYPLIYFDCLYVIAKKLAPYCNTELEYDGDNGNSLFSLMHDVFTFGEAAIRCGNINGASLAVLRLEEHCKIADESDNAKHKKYALESMFRLGSVAASAQLKGVSDFLGHDGQNLDDIAIARVAKNKGSIDLDGEAHEILVKMSTNENYKHVSAYLKKASRKFNSDFGMNLSDVINEDRGLE